MTTSLHTARRGTIGTPPGNRSPGTSVRFDWHPISGTLGTLEYDHNRRHLHHRRLHPSWQCHPPGTLRQVCLLSAWLSKLHRCGRTLPHLLRLIFVDRSQSRLFRCSSLTARQFCQTALQCMASTGRCWRNLRLDDQYFCGWNRRSRLQTCRTALRCSEERQPIGHLLAHHHRASGSANQQLERWA